MALPTVTPSRPLIISLQHLTPSSFAPFGIVVTTPLPLSPRSSKQESIPAIVPLPLHQTQTTPIFANQNTALKTSPISPLLNHYPPPDQSVRRPESKPLMSMFSCFPRATSTLKSGQLPIAILERHPYTTQTFCPLGLAPNSPDSTFIVIVAPSLPDTHATAGGYLQHLKPPETGSPSPGPRAKNHNDSPSSNSSYSQTNPTGTANTKPPPHLTRPPNLSKLKAFIGRGDMAITYGVGTWHAPMIVLGKARVDFVVTQFVNGTSDDCEEVLINGIEIDLQNLNIGIDIGAREVKAKL